MACLLSFYGPAVLARSLLALPDLNKRNDVPKAELTRRKEAPVAGRPAHRQADSHTNRRIDKEADSMLYTSIQETRSSSSWYTCT